MSNNYQTSQSIHGMDEEEFKRNLIEKLNKIMHGWIDGDKNNNITKTADLINESFKIAIEVKDDTIYKHDFPPKTGEMITGGLDLNNKSEQLKSDAQDANKKFRNYPDFKTILLIRTELVNIPYDIIEYIFNGIRRFVKRDEDLVEIGHKNKFLSFTSTKEIGSYLLFGNGKFFHMQNPNANTFRVIDKNELEKYFSEIIESI